MHQAIISLKEWNKVATQLNNLTLFLRKPYIIRLIRELEKAFTDDESINMRIEKKLHDGFLVKVNGLYSKLNFRDMPWNYCCLYQWRVVSPSLIGKVLSCKVVNIKTLPFSCQVVACRINDQIPEIKVGETYKSIVVSKTIFGVFVDAGIHFGWKYGSFFGLMHKNNMNSPLDIDILAEGQTIEIAYWGKNNEGKLIFGCNEDKYQWFKEKFDDLLYNNIQVNVFEHDNKQLTFYAHGKFKSKLCAPKKSELGIELYKRAVKRLVGGDVITCKILRVNNRSQQLHVLWNSMSEISLIGNRDFLRRKNVNGIISILPWEQDSYNDLHKLENAVVGLRVLHTGDRISFVYNDDYIALLSKEERYYHKPGPDINGALNRLVHDDIIHCRVVKVDYENSILHVIWDCSPEIAEISKRPEKRKPVSKSLLRGSLSIAESIDKDVLGKLSLFGKTVSVLVNKVDGRSGKHKNEYVVDKKFHAALNIVSSSYSLSVKEKKQIEAGLADQEEFAAEVTGYRNGLVQVKWDIDKNSLGKIP
ncbi:MAG: hypothetical protein GXO88_05930 [Chlorobi bacterium]|nr:hypothetical protein [Chlorobiota bacterium]